MNNETLRQFRDLLTVPPDAAWLPPKHFWRDAPGRLWSLDKNEAHLEEVILLIRLRRQSPLSSLIFHYKSELVAQPEINISRDPIHLISVLISRRIKPVDSDARVCEIVYYRYGGFGVCAEAGESTSRSDVIPPTQNTAEQRQPFRDRIAGVERDAIEIVPKRYVRLKRSVRAYYRDVHIAVVIIHGDCPTIEIKDTIHE